MNDFPLCRGLRNRHEYFQKPYNRGVWTFLIVFLKCRKRQSHINLFMVLTKTASISERLRTRDTMNSFTREPVTSFMTLKVTALRVRYKSRTYVKTLMFPKGSGVFKRFTTHGTSVRTALCHGVFPRESPLYLTLHKSSALMISSIRGAGLWRHTCVNQFMNLKTVRVWEHLSTCRTCIRFNTCVNPLMNLKSGELCEHISTNSTCI